MEIEKKEKVFALFKERMEKIEDGEKIQKIWEFIFSNLQKTEAEQEKNKLAELGIFLPSIIDQGIESKAETSPVIIKKRRASLNQPKALNAVVSLGGIASSEEVGNILGSSKHNACNSLIKLYKEGVLLTKSNSSIKTKGRKAVLYATPERSLIDALKQNNKRATLDWLITYLSNLAYKNKIEDSVFQTMLESAKEKNIITIGGGIVFLNEI